MDVQNLFSRRSRSLTPSPIKKFVPLMDLPGMISFGGGYPNRCIFAISSLSIKFNDDRMMDISDRNIDLACQYGPTEGLSELRAQIARWHEFKDGVNLEKDNILVLNGSQEGLHFMAYLFLNEEDWVALSEPAYPGAISAFRAFTRNFLPVEMDSQGMVVEKLAIQLAQRQKEGLPLPKFIYDIPNGHNPAGVTLSLERRRQLTALAARYGILILEDDPYQLLQLDNRPLLPSLQALDKDNLVVRLDSFSKIFAPGLRLAYVSGSPEIIQAFQLYKQGTNLHTSTLTQMLLNAFFKTHGPDEFHEIIRANCLLYKQNRDMFIQAAQKYLPPSVKFNVPQAGMFIWFTLPPEWDCAQLIERHAKDLGFLMIPGPSFSTRGGLRNCLRASFSMVTPEDIDEGMKRFAKLLSRRQ